jgi:hypothetical protein
MTTSHHPDEQALNEALTRLETALVSPVVPGELENWTREAQQAAAEVQPTLERFTHDVLHAQYAQIGKADPELLPRVETLIEEDQQLLAELQSVRATLADIVTKLPEARKDENLVLSQLGRAEQQGTAFVLRVRKQMVAAGTWLDEALFRDRGRGD